MKKFMMSCLITAVVLFFVGVALFIPACSKGAGDLSDVLDGVTDLAKNVDNFDEIGDKIGEGVQNFVDNIENEGAFNIEASDISIQFDTNFPVYENQEKVEKTLIEGQAVKIATEVGGCSLKFETSDDGMIYMEASNVEKLQTYVQDGTLMIRGKKTKFTNISDSQSMKVTVYLPAGQTFENMELDLGAGALDLNAVSADQVKIDVGAGSFTSTGLQTNDLDINVGMGAVKLKEMQAGEMEASVGMGAFSFDGTLLGDGKFECAMGSIDGVLNGDEKDFNYDVSGAMGEVKVGTTGAKGLAKDWKQDNGSNKTITLECSMGSAKIGFR